MKKSLLVTIVLSLLALGAPASAEAQNKPSRLELSGMAGYQFGGYVNTYRGEIQFQGSELYGVMLDFRVTKEALLGLSYSYQPTDVRFRGFLEPLGSIAVQNHYFHFGGQYEVIRLSRFRPFVGFALGLTHFSPSEGYQNETRFSGILSGGAKFAITNWLSLRAQADLRMAFLGGSFFCGIGTGGSSCGVAVTSAFAQGTFWGGLAITL